MKLPKFETQKELFNYLKENKDDLIYEKKETVKYADAYSFSPTILREKTADIRKGATGVEENAESFKVRAVINTTDVLDSHGDVHVKGIWNKTVKENRRMKHIQEHDMSFRSIIADKDDLKASVQTYKWRDLGIDKNGTTEALVFDSNIRKSRNSYMFEQYKLGNVDNHSVGMRYISVELAVNDKDEEFEEEKAVWDKHIDDIVNKEEAEARGYFWAVYEAKAIEGSAVPIGSNTITPTLEPKSITQVEETSAVDKAQVERFNRIINQKIL